MITPDILDRICAQYDAGCHGYGLGPDWHDGSSQSGGDLGILCREEFAGSASNDLLGVGCPDERRADHALEITAKTTDET